MHASCTIFHVIVKAVRRGDRIVAIPETGELIVGVVWEIGIVEGILDSKVIVAVEFVRKQSSNPCFCTYVLSLIKSALDMIHFRKMPGEATGT